MSSQPVNSFQDALRDLLAPLVAATDKHRLRDLLDRIGQTSAVADDANVQQVISNCIALAGDIESIDTSTLDSLEGIQHLIETAGTALTALRALDSVQIANLAGALDGLGSDLATFLLTSYLRRNHAALFRIASTLTLIDSREMHPLEPALEQNGEAIRFARVRDQFRFSNVNGLLSNPGFALSGIYLPNGMATGPDADLGAGNLFPHLALLAQMLGLSWRVGSQAVTAPSAPTPLSDESLQADHLDVSGEGDLTPSQPLPDLSTDFFNQHQSKFSFLLPTAAVAGTALAVDVLASSLQHPGAIAGYLVSLSGAINSSQTIGSWRLSTSSSGQIPAFVVGANGLTQAGSAAGEGELHVLLENVQPVGSTGPAFVLGGQDSSRIEFGTLQLSADLLYGSTRKALELTAATSSSALVIAGGDGFIASLLPQDGFRANFDLGLTLSSDSGIKLRGSAGLDATFPVSVSVAGVSLSSLHLGVHAIDGSASVEVSANISAAIGPVNASIERIGVQASVGFPATGGNLGVADLSLGFKSPSGVGLSVDAHGVVTGGGFLFHDETQGTYAGAMQLSLHEQLTLKAFGLIATRLPDGSRGYSLLVFITAEDFRPIQLGLGFTLLGIGGMIAINRTFDQDVLRQGLKNDTLGTLLFPRDPVGNAPALIQALSSAFPARRGSYLLGLLAKIGWFTPTLVLMDLALILEFGGRTRLLALGRISAKLPTADNDLVRLNLDALGVIDFDAQTMAIDAVLVDSRLVHKFAITGAGALRAGFGSGPDSTFVLAVGGLHPHFAPPANFPVLERVTMSLSSGTNPRLVCESYFAITANTIQFGARASLFAGAAGFSVEGDIGYDVLVQLAPLHFIADFDARLQLKRGSSTLFMVEVKGELEGPRPLRVSGKATFKIWFVHFSVRFDATLVDGEPPPLPPAINVRDLLTQALLAQDSWSTQRVNDAAHGVALRTLPASTTIGSGLVLDPLGQLTIKQQVVPLNTGRDIDTFGGAPLSGDRRFAVTASFGADTTQGGAVNAPFAPAQYFNLSDDEKLAAPSFESMQSGCVFGSAATLIDERDASLIAAPLNYTTIVIDDEAPALAPHDAVPYAFSAQRLQSFARSGAAARAPVRRVGRARFRNQSTEAPATLNAKRWAIIARADTTGATASVAPTVRNWSEYQATLKSLNRSRNTWQLIPAHELP